MLQNELTWDWILHEIECYLSYNINIDTNFAKIPFNDVLLFHFLPEKEDIKDKDKLHGSVRSPSWTMSVAEEHAVSAIRFGSTHHSC